jgi:hypothetical protein
VQAVYSLLRATVAGQQPVHVRHGSGCLALLSLALVRAFPGMPLIGLADCTGDRRFDYPEAVCEALGNAYAESARDVRGLIASLQAPA